MIKEATVKLWTVFRIRRKSYFFTYDLFYYVNMMVLGSLAGSMKYIDCLLQLLIQRADRFIKQQTLLDIFYAMFVFTMWRILSVIHLLLTDDVRPYYVNIHLGCYPERQFVYLVTVQ